MKRHECDCPCHSGMRKHAIACCRPCPKCKKRIKNDCYGKHISGCRAGRKPNKRKTK